MKITLCIIKVHEIKGKNTKFVRFLTILNSPLFRFAEPCFVEVNLFQHGSTKFLWFNVV